MARVGQPFKDRAIRVVEQHRKTLRRACHGAVASWPRPTALRARHAEQDIGPKGDDGDVARVRREGNLARSVSEAGRRARADARPWACTARATSGPPSRAPRPRARRHRKDTAGV